MFLLAFVFSAGWFVTGSMAAHLPALLERAGASPHQAIAAAALVGPAQVAARLAEFALVRRIHPLVSARVAAALHPIGAAVLAIAGAAAAPAFVILYGAGNGLLTIARGTVPLALFGPLRYGERTGLIGAPARVAQAFAPFLFGLLLDRLGVAAISVSAALCLAALAALLCLRMKPASTSGATAVPRSEASAGERSGPSGYSIARHFARRSMPLSIGSASSRPAICAMLNPGASAWRMPAKVSVKARATVTAGLAKDVDAVNQ